MARLHGNDVAFVAASLTQAWAATQNVPHTMGEIEATFEGFLDWVANKELPTAPSGYDIKNLT